MKIINIRINFDRHYENELKKIIHGIDTTNELE